MRTQKHGDAFHVFAFRGGPFHFGGRDAVIQVAGTLKGCQGSLMGVTFLVERMVAMSKGIEQNSPNKRMRLARRLRVAAEALLLRLVNFDENFAGTGRGD